MNFRSSIFYFVVFVLIPLFASTLAGQPDSIGIRPVTNFLNNPVYLTHAGDGTNRLFILEQRGKIKVLQPGASVPTQFLDVSHLVSSTGGERGLLGLAFHPDYSANRRFFIFYTRETDGAVEIAEYEASPEDRDTANPSPVRVIITIPHPVANHNGGTILFGPDGYLYAGIGDGSGGNDSENNSQNLSLLLGKFIRIDVNTPVDQVPAYNIPPTNPYAGVPRGREEIYAVGFRNPYRFSFDRGGTNELWVGDVGQEAIEEVDIVTLGGNYGWRVFEGTECTGLDPDPCKATAKYQAPVLEYVSGGSEPRCAVTGGHVYRGPLGTFPTGTYVYADFCTGEIFNWIDGEQVVRFDLPGLPTAIGEDEEGELYVVSLGGTVHKLVRRLANADFDGDLRTDISIFRPSSGAWYLNHSSDGSVTVEHFGLSSDIPAAEDFDGDLITDVAVYRPGTGQWFYIRSSDGTVGIVEFGTSGDVPAAADYDGDRRADPAIYRPSTSTWYVLPSGSGIPGQRTFGAAGDIPVPGDYDGDGRHDFALWRPSTGVWYWSNHFNDSITQRQFGLAGDIPAQGDFDGDGKTDVGVFRPSLAAWYTTHSQAGTVYFTEWGLSGDIPVVGDYDGDGWDDIAVFRPGEGDWFILRSSDQESMFVHFGLNGDLPIPGFDVP